MGKEVITGQDINRENVYDKIRRYLRYVSIAMLGIGAVFGNTAMVGGAMLDIAADMTLGKEVSKHLKKKKGEK